MLKEVSGQQILYIRWVLKSPKLHFTYHSS